ncbi:asparagine synthase (glutamine-hydrolyzing) [Pelagibacteraceae bacterium]|nr:asparagine synthase (glutamine-hydrolyzing) [Pelagibacteraceae bacterium]
MCGINGIIFKTSIADVSKILKMNALLNHRGPDDSGFINHKNLLLGHTRLSIIDTSNLGSQPMSVDGRYWIIYNGEIYNYKTLKEELILKKYKFYSNSDTEVVLNAYKEWGVDSFQRFNGEWSFAILDKKNNEIIICRDGIGYKPCYIFENKNFFAFSSEIKTFYALEKSIEFDKNNLGIHFTTINNCSKTIFKNINQLTQGRYLKINLNSLEKKFSRWDYPLKNLPKINSGFRENVNEYFDLLYKSTKLRLNSDVKTGTSLSGGLDSSSIFILMNLIQKKEKLAEDDLDLNPIIMDYKEMKTKGDAIELSKKFKRNYQIVDFKKITADSTMDLVTSLEVVEEYFIQFELYKRQKEKGIKVSLDGHGADEFLAYPNWIPELSVDFYNGIANNFKIVNKFGNTQNINKFKKIFGLGEQEIAPISFKSVPDLNYGFKNYLNIGNFDGSYQIINDDLEDLENFSYELCFTYLMSYCGWFQFFLNKWDRASMANSVEVRMPFLDNNVRLFGLALSSSNKLKNGFTKSVLREAFKNYFTKSMYTQQFKQGLTIQNVDYDENTINLISEIINESEFKESNVYNFKNINDDFINNKNLDKIWLLCKYFLMIKGFKNKYDSIDIDLKAKEKSNLLNS